VDFFFSLLSLRELVIARVNFNADVRGRPCVKRIKVGSSSAEDDGAGAQTGLGLAGRMEQSDDGRYPGDRATDTVGTSEKNGLGRLDGRRTGQRGSGRDSDSVDNGDGDDAAAGVGCRKDTRSHFRQH